MSSNKLYSEVLEDFEAAETRAEKIAVLQKHDHYALREFFIIAFNPGITIDVNIPTYRDSIEPAGLNHTYLDQEMRRMYLYMSGHPKAPAGLTPEKKTKQLLTTLESLHKDEAALLVKMLKKDLGVKYLTPKLIAEAYPGIEIGE
jgi:hypothetical protein